MQATNALDLIDDKNWFSERNSQWPGIANSFKVKKVLLETQTKFQHLMVFESENHGKILTLDGVIQFTEAHEFIYHEMLAHVTLFSHPNPKRILIIGGGDGGVIRELCKHESVEEIIWCEIDEQVIEYSLKYFPKISSVANTDVRVHKNIGDGNAFLRNCKSCSFDVIIVDSSDPVGPAEVLFGQPFYNECHRVLSANGILCTQAECFFEHSELIRELIANAKKAFVGGNVKYSSMYIPMYPYGQIGCLLSQKKSDGNTTEMNVNDVTKACREIPYEMKKTLKYYSHKMHAASFVIPPFITSKL